MDLGRRLLPWVAAGLTSARLERWRHRTAELARRLARRPHEVVVFYRVEDPYSHLLAQALADVRTRFDVLVTTHVVAELPPDEYSAPELWAALALRDAAWLARLYGLDFSGVRPVDEPEMARQATAVLVAAEMTGRLADLLVPVGEAFWRGDRVGLARHAAGLSPPSPAGVERRLRANERLLRRRGHYQSAMLRYGGEWYGGIDRLDHLEGRLRRLGLGRGADVARWTRTWQPFCYGPAGAGAGGPALDFFFSLRSPYSYLAFDRTLRLADHYAIPIRLRPVLPMVMRGLRVSRKKRMYILRDAAREARKLDIPFGRISDPVGRPVERGYALLDYAESRGRLREFLSFFFRAVWAEGVDAGTDTGLSRIVERAGLSWDDARRWIGEDSWRLRVEENQRLLGESGLWGVPSYRYGEIRTWGQDRLWIIEGAVLEGTAGNLSAPKRVG